MINDRPWMTALEMQVSALAETIRSLRRIDRGVPERGDFRTPVARMADALRNGATFAWSDNTASAVQMASRSIPADSGRPSLASASAGWWWLGGAVDEAMSALLWHVDDRRDLWLDVFGVTPGRTPVPLPIMTFLWKQEETLGRAMAREQSRDHYIGGVNDAGEVIEEKTEGPVSAAPMAFFAAGLTWLEQRIVTRSAGHVERHRRKQLAREYGLTVSDVKVVELRRREHEQRQGHGCESFDWSCRWIVNGHWRNQPYKDGKKLIYIMPFVKGPEDKPLKVPAHTVYQVSR